MDKARCIAILLQILTIMCVYDFISTHVSMRYLSFSNATESNCNEIEQTQGFTTKKARFRVIFISLTSTTHWSYFPSLSEEAI